MKEFDFSGYATKNDLKCSDGRTIRKDAFKHNDGQKVPLVWQHMHNEPTNILGFALLENKEDGVYAYGKFNSTPSGVNAKALVEHGDITALSIYANGLKQKGGDVLHGAIREVSLVMAGANPGAWIDNVSIEHSDGSIDNDGSEAIIFTGESLVQAQEEEEEDMKHENAPAAGKTVKDIFDGMTDEQKNVVYFMIGTALEGQEGQGADAEHSEDEDEDDIVHSEGGSLMKKNIFEKDVDTNDNVLSHADVMGIFADFQECGSLKEALKHAETTYGIENIDYLFPDAKNIRNTPDWVKRNDEWVGKVMSGSNHIPFSRVKSMSADITLDTARAKGYVKGNLKKEEFFAISKRTTGPTTIYKKQKLDRDDIIDIIDFDVVGWLKLEMRMMLEEEAARSMLIGDGREADDEDKINESCIRPIAKDDPFYAHPVNLPANTGAATLVEQVLRNRANYKGSGMPTFFTYESIIADLLLVKDSTGRRIYNTLADVAAAMRCSDIVAVEPMEGFVTDTGTLIGVMVNMSDYTVGADKGGQTTSYEDFDIDYNQQKYLIEGRFSAALTKPKSALIFWRADGTAVAPTVPTFVQGTNTVTIPTKAGVTYKVDGVITAAGNVVITKDAIVTADANTGYYFAPNTTDSWVFTYEEIAG